MKLIGVVIIIIVLCGLIFGAFGIGKRGNKRADQASAKAKSIQNTSEKTGGEH